MTDEVRVAAGGSILYSTLLGRGELAVVMLHGQFGTSGVLAPLAAPIAGEYRVLLPDIRGRGRSKCRDPARHTWARYASDVADVLDGAEVERAAIVGVSMGAGVAIATAMRHPGRVAGLLLVSSPYAGAETGWTPGQIKIQSGLISTAESILTRAPESMAESPSEKWARHDLLSVAAAISGLGLTQPFDSGEQLSSVPAPAVVISGSDDLHPPEVAEIYRRSFAHWLPAAGGGLALQLRAFLKALKEGGLKGP